MARHVARCLVPKDPVEGRLGGDAIRNLGMQGIRPPPQAHQDMTPEGGVPQGLGEGVRHVPGRPFGGGGFAWQGCPGEPGYPPPSLAHAKCPPPTGLKGRPLESLPPRGPGLGAHHLLRKVSEISTTSAHNSQGRDIGLRHAHQP